LGSGKGGLMTSARKMRGDVNLSGMKNAEAEASGGTIIQKIAPTEKEEGRQDPGKPKESSSNCHTGGKRGERPGRNTGTVELTDGGAGGREARKLDVRGKVKNNGQWRRLAISGKGEIKASGLVRRAVRRTEGETDCRGNFTTK